MKIGDYIDEAIDKVFLEEPEHALVQISIAVDATAREKYGSNKVGDRIRKFATENEVFILNTALNGIVTFQPNATTFSSLGKFDDIVYKVIRCPSVHGDDVSKHIVYLKECRVGLDDGKFIVTPLFLWGLIFSVVGEVVNSTQILKKNYQVQFGRLRLNLNDFWGQMDKLKSTVTTAQRSMFNQ